jgi:serine protease Do
MRCGWGLSGVKGWATRRILRVLVVGWLGVIGMPTAWAQSVPPAREPGSTALATNAAPEKATPANRADPGPDTQPTGGAKANGAAEPVSDSAQRAYERARSRLVQVRTLLKDQGSQATVGSGFLVATDGSIITNYHVVSQAALQPQRYRLTFSTTDGEQGLLDLLAFDVVHDLALVRVREPSPNWAARGALPLRPASIALKRGERIYSLGNPLDVGFAVVEGNYNGLVERSFLPQVFFSGSLNPGMSGGPALDEQGRVMGVNVASRRDGEQVSFLVPADAATALLERARKAKPALQPITGDVYPEISRQLFEHQQQLTQRFIALPWRSAGHSRYRIPVPQEDFMRCWGSTSSAQAKGLAFERSDCQMDTYVFVSDALQTGNITVRHEALDGSKLGPLRFARVYSNSFAAESFGASDKAMTGPQCAERFLDREGLALRTVVCFRAHKKLKGLHDLSVLVASVDAPTQGVLGRFDARAVSFNNGLRLVDHYLKGFSWQPSKP